MHHHVMMMQIWFKFLQILFIGYLHLSQYHNVNWINDNNQYFTDTVPTDLDVYHCVMAILVHNLV